jgi:hypothetical protein
LARRLDDGAELPCFIGVVDLTAAIALNPKDIVAYRFRALAFDAKRDTKRASMGFETQRQLDTAAR